MPNNFKKGFVLGTLIGALGSFFAFSEKTSTLRKKIRVEADDIFEKIKVRAGDLSNISKDTYDKFVDEAMENYEETKRVSADLLSQMSDELKARWEEIQLYFLYKKLRLKLKTIDKVTKEKFNELAEDLVEELAEANEAVGERSKQLIRKLKNKWADFKQDLDDNDET